MPAPSTAFVLGAGLGTRLRPLTRDCPKPLLPVAGRPMITHAFDRLIACGIRQIIINTHHAAHRYAEAFPEGRYLGIPLTFVHEPVLLDTGGGLKNIQSLIPRNEPLLVHNGDILAGLPLEPMLQAHAAVRPPATLALRSQGHPRNVALAADGAITDFRGLRGAADPLHLFAGIYLIEPFVLAQIPPGQPVSIIDTFLELIRLGTPPRGVVVDDGPWHDLGTLEEYEKIRDRGIERPCTQNP